MSTLGKYWAVYSVMLRNSLIRDMNFKLNFLLWMVVESRFGSWVNWFLLM